jgi:flavin reductase (DIM6/NTAB) family NADH-FMN oxidoreductase RutF
MQRICSLYRPLSKFAAPYLLTIAAPGVPILFFRNMSTNPTWTVGASQATPLSDNWKQFDPSDQDNKFSQYYMLISCCVPRPIALVSTVNESGARNCAPFSYFSTFIHLGTSLASWLVLTTVLCIGQSVDAVCHDPMIVSVTVCMNGRGAERSKKDTLINIEETSEFVVNIMSEWFVESANHTCGAFPYGTDEIALSGLNTLPSVKVKPERIRESAVQLECKVQQLIPIMNDLGEHTSTVVYGRVVNIHANDFVLDESQGQVDITKLKPMGRAGGNTYITVGNTFDMARPKV